MLILTRRISESLIIGNSIIVTVLDIRDYQVRIGIEAPKHITVDRQEIYLRKQAEVKVRQEQEFLRRIQP